jgi:hypothetical protein
MILLRQDQKQNKHLMLQRRELLKSIYLPDRREIGDFSLASLVSDLNHVRVYHFSPAYNHTPQRARGIGDRG